MFGRRYFGARHFGPRYWGDGGGGAPPVVPDVLEYRGRPRRRRKEDDLHEIVQKQWELRDARLRDAEERQARSEPPPITLPPPVEVPPPQRIDRNRILTRPARLPRRVPIHIEEGLTPEEIVDLVTILEAIEEDD